MSDLGAAAEMLGRLLMGPAARTVFGSGPIEEWTVCGLPYREVREELQRQIGGGRVVERLTVQQMFPDVTSFRDAEPKYFTPFGILTESEIEERLSR